VAFRLLLGHGAGSGVDVAAALLLTYALHAVVWTSAAAGLARHESFSSRTQNALWKLALFAPLATACLALALTFGPALGTLVLPARDVLVPWVTATAPLLSAVPRASALWSTLGAGAEAAALLGLLRWLAQALLFAQSLRARRPVLEARLLERLERLRCRTGVAKVTLTASSHVHSPVVVGLSEICVPPAVLTLGAAELDSVLAHELSHIERRDGIWFPLVGLAQAVLWLQPLSAWVAARFRSTAEEACDDRAVELTRDAHGLARVLVQLAAAASPRARTALAPGMANSKGALLKRVRRLTAAPKNARGRASRYATLLAGFGLSATAFATASLSVHVASARTLPASKTAVASRDPATLPAATLASPDAAAVSAQLAELARRAKQVETSIALAATLPDAEHVGSPTAVRLLELRQSLDHLRATEQWTEARFLEDESAWQKHQRGDKP